ncbi:MAG: hypothetical protein ACR2N4_05150 [Jatrophihabitans sp.]
MSPQAFTDWIRPLPADHGAAPTDGVALSRLPAGDFAVLDWLDEALGRCRPGRERAAVEAALIAGWDRLSLREVYAMLVTDLLVAEAEAELE